MTTVMHFTTVRTTTTDFDDLMDGSMMDGSMITMRHGRRYSQGWKSKEEKRKPAARVARVISQDYNVIKQECLAQKALWEDPTFPAHDRSLYPSSLGRLPFKWMRPSVSALYTKAAFRSTRRTVSTNYSQFYAALFLRSK